ncbi:MAG: Xaa-Pro peptidase family protein [Acidobacteriia bacterium]|nr:Xaa-Pro peptidase family protein [Terriglobia bacterium]
MRNVLLSIAVVLSSFCCAALDLQPKADYHARRVALSQKTEGGVVVLFAATEAEGQNDVYGFKQNNNFFYLTGWVEPGAAVLIAPELKEGNGQPARPYTEILFLPAHNVTQEKWTGPKLGPEDPRAREVTGFDRVEMLDKLRDELVKILPQPRATVLSDLGETSPSADPLKWLKRANAFPNYISFQDVKPLVTALRMAKDRGEMQRIQHAVDASVAAHLAAMKAMKPGITEREISALMQYEFEKRGCERPAYSPIVGSGLNSTVLHYSEDSGTAQAGDVVVIDVAGEYAGYAADITRTLPATGKFTARQREIYDIVLGAQKAAATAFVAGNSKLIGSDSLYTVAKDYINAHGKDLHGEPLGKYFIHGLGHQVGLAVHDADNRAPLDKGMVFTIEPGIYIPEEKLGVRIEDMFWVDENGKLVRLTAKLPQAADEVEKTMAGR